MRSHNTLPLILLCLSGCALFNDHDTQHITFRVEPSPLDHVAMLYHPAADNPSGGNVCKIDISGSGLITLREGSSERVTEDFWQKPQSENWNDIRTDTLQLSPEATRLLLQRIVDCGAFPSVKRKASKPSHTPFVILQSKISLNSSFQITNDRRFIHIANLLLDEFSEQR